MQRTKQKQTACGQRTASRRHASNAKSARPTDQPGTDSKQTELNKDGQIQASPMATRETNNNKDLHWKQRFAHFKKAFRLQEQTMAIEHPSEAERAGLIQFSCKVL
jgi:hypothetical protein